MLRRTIRSSILILALVAPAGGISEASIPPLWGDLQPGSYAIGFNSAYYYDYSRSWRLDLDNFGRVIGRHARPIRITYWFPAQRAGPQLTFSSYVKYSPTGDIEFDSINAFLTERDARDYLNGDFGGDIQTLNLLLNAPVYASNAEPATGRYPLLLYGAGWNSLSLDNVLLCEYLASHGYVVATVPQLPRDSSRAELSADAVDIRVQLRDLEFARGVMEQQPFVNSEVEGVIGYSLSGVVALWMAMSTPGIRAVATLDPSFGYQRFVDLTMRADEFKPDSYVAPTLVLRSTLGANVERTTAVIDRLRFSDVFLGAVANAEHGEFSDYPAIRGTFDVTSPEATTKADAEAARNAIAQCTLAFFDTALRKHEIAGKGLCSNGPTISMSVRPGLHPPSIADIANIGLTKGDAGLALVIEDWRKHDPEVVGIDEATYNAAGYHLLSEGKVATAIVIFKANAMAHPGSANTYDSLADAYRAANLPVQAANSYRTLLTIVKSDSSLSPDARAALIERAQSYLRTTAPP